MLTMLRIILAAALLCVVGPAFAGTSSTISGALLVPLYDAITQQILVPIIAGFLAALLGIIWTYAAKFLNIKLTDSQRATKDSLIANLVLSASSAAGRMFASEDANVAKMQINVHSPLIAAELPKVIERAAPATQELNISDDRVKDLILAEFGKLQAQAQGAAPVVAVLPVETPKVPS